MLSKSIWLSLKPETRQVLVKTFNLKKVGFVDVFDGKVTEDGYGASLPDISLEKLQVALDSKDDNFYKLFNQMIDRIEGREVVIAGGVEKMPDGNVTDYSKMDKRSKVYKQAKKDGLI